MINQVITDYLLDVQPGLTKVIAADDGTNTERYIHGPRGIHAMEDSSGNWLHPAQDGLGSVRMQIDDTVGVDAIQNIGPYGDLFGKQGTIDMPFGFTGEQVDSNNLVYLRARYYDPSLGIFPSLDPFEGVHDSPMSMNGYSWVEGNVPNQIDPSGNNPERGEMERGDKFRYSCNCGWLDAAHMDFGVPEGIEGLVFNHPIDWELASRIDSRLGQYKLRAITPIIHAAGVSWGTSYVVINENHPDYLNNPEGVALSVWMSMQEKLEGSQHFPVGLISPTSFSIEDLVSNLTGYAAYKSGQRWDTPSTNELFFSLGWESADYSNTWDNEWLRQECDILSKEESLDMFDRFEETGGFSKNYGWSPLPLPAGVQNPYCDVDVTTAYQNTRMAQLLTTAASPGFAGQDGSFWWEFGHAGRWQVSLFDSSAQEWPVIRDSLYVTLPFGSLWGGGC